MQASSTVQTRLQALTGLAALQRCMGVLRGASAVLLLLCAMCAPLASAQATSPAITVQTVMTTFTDNDHSNNVTAGDQLFYTITATNIGDVQLTNVHVSDSVSSSTSNCPTVAVNSTCVLHDSYFVQAADAAGGAVVNQGEAFSNETDNVDSTVITQVFGNQMTILIQENDISSGTPTTGDVLHYRILVTNQNNTGNLTNVQINDSTLSPSHGTSCATLAPSAICELDGNYTVTTGDVANGFVNNTASATSDQVPGGVSYSLRTNVTTGGTNFHSTTTASLSSNADNDHSGSITVGDVLTVTDTAVNTGNGTLTGVVVNDALLTPSFGSCASVAVNASCVLTGTHTVTTADAAAGQIIFQPNTSASNSTSDHDVPLILPVATAGGAAMSVIMDIDNLVDVDHSGTVTPGDTVQFVVTAINSGSVPLTNVQVSNPQATPSTTTCANVAVGATCVLNGTYTLVASDISTSMKLTTTGSATSTQVPGPVSLTRDLKIDGNTVDTTSMQVVSGNGQTGTPGSTLPTPLTVRLSSPNNTALPGYGISFLVLSGNGHVTTSTAVTDGTGQASTQLVLPATPGVVTILACQFNNGGGECAPDALFTETATGPAATNSLTIVSGNNQTLPINTTSAPLIVQLTANGTPVPNATINWSGTNVHLSTATSLTDINGHATNTATVTQAGSASVSASSASPAAGPVSFALNGGLASQPGLTPQQVAVATTLDNACPALTSLSNPTPVQQDLLAQCQALASAQNTGQVQNALNQMLPHDTLIQSNASVLVSSAQFDNIKARMAALRSGAHGGGFGGLAFTSPDGSLQVGRLGETALGVADDKKADETGSDFDRWGFFASGNFGWGSADPRTITPGYGFHTNGLTAGIDYRFNDNWILGASAGYANYSSNVDNVGGGLDTHGWSLSGYTTLYQKSNWYIDGVLTWGSNTYDINRRIVYTLGATTVNQTATSSSGGNTLAGALTFGRDFNKGPWSFGPYFRGMYAHTSFDGYQETLVSSSTGSGLGLAVQSRSLKSLSTVLGAKVNYASSQSWGVLSPHAEIEWEHEYENNPDTVNARFLADPTSTMFTIKGDPVDTNFFRMGLGVSFTLPKGKSGFVYYEKTLGITGLTQDNISLGFRMEF